MPRDWDIPRYYFVFLLNRKRRQEKIVCFVLEHVICDAVCCRFSGTSRIESGCRRPHHFGCVHVQHIKNVSKTIKCNADEMKLAIHCHRRTNSITTKNDFWSFNFEFHISLPVLLNLVPRVSSEEKVRSPGSAYHIVMSVHVQPPN